MTIIDYAWRNVAFCAAVAFLAGCGGGNVVGPAGPSGAQVVVPEAIHSDVNSSVTILYKGKPTQKGSWAKLLDNKGTEVGSALTNANGTATFRNVPQKMALRLKFQVKWEECTGKFPNIKCQKFNVTLAWPPLDKLQPPPFPVSLECDVIKNKNLCKKT